MFYLLSKSLWFLLQPSSLIALGLSVGCVQSWRSRHRSGQAWVLGSLVALGVCGLSALGEVLAMPLESRFARAEILGQHIDGIIVLGGMEDGSLSSRELMPLNDAAERITEGIALALRLPGTKLILSGAAVDEHGVSTSQRLADALGLRPERIVHETQSRTTYENAAYARKLLQPMANQRYVLVTSAWHMPRAVGAFRGQGIDVLAWPVDYRGPEQFSWLRTTSSISHGLSRTDLIVKEYVGLLAYWLTKRSPVLLPKA